MEWWSAGQNKNGGQEGPGRKLSSGTRSAREEGYNPVATEQNPGKIRIHELGLDIREAEWEQL